MSAARHPPTRSPARRTRDQRGGAALLLLLVLSAVAALIGALAIRGAITDVRVAGAMRQSKTAFYCAEAGLSAARAFFGASYPLWAAMFDAGLADPPGYPVTGDVNGDGTPDFTVTLVDNVDEFPVPNPNQDNDLTAVMVSRCTNVVLGDRTVQEIVTANLQGTNYRHQAGHGTGHAGTQN